MYGPRVHLLLLFPIRKPLRIGVILYAATNFPVDVDAVSRMRYDHTGVAARLHTDEHGREAPTQRRQHKSHIKTLLIGLICQVRRRNA